MIDLSTFNSSRLPNYTDEQLRDFAWDFKEREKKARKVADTSSEMHQSQTKLGYLASASDWEANRQAAMKIADDARANARACHVEQQIRALGT